MKIKLPFTEKFLWDLYNFKNKSGNLISRAMPKHSSNPAIAFKELFLPNFCSFKEEWGKNYRGENSKKKFAQLVWRLKSGGHLKTLRVKDKAAVIITSKGMERLFKINLKAMDKKSRKDKRWQMVLFDIPETKRRYRDYFREGLQYLGYKKLQNSIWVCPHDIEKETKDLINRYSLKPFVELLLVKKIGLN